MSINSLSGDLLLSSLDQKKLEPKDQTMGKDQFLKLLIAQLSNQDPTQPMEDKEFIAQMASFSTLEQMTNMSNSFEKFASMQEQTQLIQYNEFVGKEIKWDKLELAGGENVASSGTGKVEAVRFKGSTVEFELADGTLLNPGNISEVYSGENHSSLQQASMLIGKKVSWMTEKDEQLESKVLSVSKKEGVIWAHTENDKKIAVEDLLQITQ
ncbi:flagellar hook assembly protein FlgD [Jeotgalibacillus proteolyticus]|uniref:Basal-body rod modification protein FlgD n=1 Tax=Jeotgalibacillus proteolyticus TaxID=2082395 RepID=A0A2S5GGR3_9BACL|nr:flagellar hook assembly protein FlgD [Jeotgalibacillus proteolyticus]PPA72053.1 flagellar hook assembly protein FlgD [Jeotgalibacillus proteolyticus]